jgi:serine protease Do
VQRGWLGVSIENVTSVLAKELDLDVNEGAYVRGFDEKHYSAAKEAGVKEGDVIVKIDEAPIKSTTALIEYIGRHRPGDKVNIVVNRKGKEVKLPVTLKNREGNVSAVKVEEKSGYAALGFQVEDIDAKLLKKLDIEHGVRVTDVGNGKLAKYTDMRKGFIITKVNDTKIKSVKEFNEIMKSKKPNELVIFSGVYDDFPREYNYALRM